MQILELLNLAKWFDNTVVTPGIISEYGTLSSLITQNAQRGTGQAIPFEDQKNKLFESIKDINYNSLTLEQIKYLERIKVSDLLGESGINQIEAIISKHNLDIATAAEKIEDISKIISNAEDNFAEITRILKKTFGSEDGYELPEGHIQLRIYFKDDVAINNLSDFKELSSLWYSIGRGFAMAQNDAPESITILGAEKGSIIIDLCAAVGIVVMISKALIEALKVVERIQSIRKLHEEVVSLKLDNDIKKSLADAIANETKDGQSKIVTTLLNGLHLKKESDGDIIKALTQSIEELIKFLNKGGAVDIIEPITPDNEESGTDTENDSYRDKASELTNNLSEIRALENRIKQLENNTINKNNY